MQAFHSVNGPRGCSLGVRLVHKLPTVSTYWPVPNHYSTLKSSWQLQHNHWQFRALPSHRQAAPGLNAQQRSERPTFDQHHWDKHAPAVLNRLGVASASTPLQLWQQFHDSSRTPHQQQQLQEQLQQHLDLQSCRLLLKAASATCSTQQQFNQLRPLIQAAAATYHEFELTDFQLLLQLCARARYIPDKEGLAALIYADTGGFERLYQKSAAEDIVHLFADLSAVFSSHRQLFIDTQKHSHLLQQQQQQNLGPHQHDQTATDLLTHLAAEAAALQAALDMSTANLMAIQQDQLLAGELSAVAGFWLVQRLLPQLATGEHINVATRGFTALPGLSYQVLDAAEADNLLNLLTLHLQTWSPNQIASVLSSTLPCLGHTVPTDGNSLALLFAAGGAAAFAGMGAQEAGQLLIVLAGLPGYAPDAQVAQALLDCALQPPLKMTARQLYQLLSAASELGAKPRQQQLQLIQEVLNG